MADEFVKVASLSDIPPGDMLTVKVGPEEILLVNLEGELHACDDICTHAYASLSEGRTWKKGRLCARCTARYSTSPAAGRLRRRPPKRCANSPSALTETTFSSAR